MYPLVRPLIYQLSILHSFIHSFTYPFIIHPLIHSCVHPSIHSHIHSSSIHLSIIHQPVIHLSIHLFFIHTFTYPCIHPLTHEYINLSFIHSAIPSSIHPSTRSICLTRSPDFLLQIQTCQFSSLTCRTPSLSSKIGTKHTFYSGRLGSADGSNRFSILRLSLNTEKQRLRPFSHF